MIAPQVRLCLTAYAGGDENKMKDQLTLSQINLGDASQFNTAATATAP